MAISVTYIDFYNALSESCIGNVSDWPGLFPRAAQHTLPHSQSLAGWSDTGVMLEGVFLMESESNNENISVGKRQLQ